MRNVWGGGGGGAASLVVVGNVLNKRLKVPTKVSQLLTVEVHSRCHRKRTSTRYLFTSTAVNVFSDNRDLVFVKFSKRHRKGRWAKTGRCTTCPEGLSSKEKVHAGGPLRK